MTLDFKAYEMTLLQFWGYKSLYTPSCPIQWWAIAHGSQNGKEGWGVYPGVGGALLLPLLLAVRECSACDCKGGGEEIEECCAY